MSSTSSRSSSQSDLRLLHFPFATASVLQKAPGEPPATPAPSSPASSPAKSRYTNIYPAPSPYRNEVLGSSSHLPRPASPASIYIPTPSPLRRHPPFSLALTPSPSTPRRASRLLPSQFLTPASPTLPILAMSLQIHAPAPSSPSHYPHDLPRPPSRSERLLRETLRRDRALSLSPRSRVQRTESLTGRAPSDNMFDCACNDEDDDDYEPVAGVSLLFQHPQQAPPKSPRAPMHRASKSMAEVPPARRGRERQREWVEKDGSALPSPSSSTGSMQQFQQQQQQAPHRAVLRSQLESVLRGSGSQARERHTSDNSEQEQWQWSSQSSSMSSPTSSHQQPLTPSPSPPSYAALPASSSVSPALSRAPSARGRARHHTHPQPIAHYQPLPAPAPNPRPRPAQPGTASSSGSSGHASPLTPPPTPPTFDAQSAAAKLRAMDGYVSFANVEGLGAPPGMHDGEDGEEEKRRGWWRWPVGRGRERSGSLGAAQ